MKGTVGRAVSVFVVAVAGVAFAGSAANAATVDVQFFATGSLQTSGASINSGDSLNVSVTPSLGNPAVQFFFLGLAPPSAANVVWHARCEGIPTETVPTETTWTPPRASGTQAYGVRVIAGVQPGNCTLFLLEVSGGVQPDLSGADSATWNGVDGSPLSIAQNPASITAGDSLTVAFSSSDAQAQFGISTTSDCSSPFEVNSAGGTAIVAPSSSTTYSIFATDGVNRSLCTSLTVNVTGTPPPDVSEAPLAAGLLGVVVVAFGAGFFVLRRRAARSAV
jgi:hypothetical protein